MIGIPTLMPSRFVAMTADGQSIVKDPLQQCSNAAASAPWRYVPGYLSMYLSSEPIPIHCVSFWLLMSCATARRVLLSHFYNSIKLKKNAKLRVFRSTVT